MQPGLTPLSAFVPSCCPDGISYYVVALARRSSSDLSLLEMHERSSCHPGIRTTVGWTVPIGYLVNTSQISVGEQCNFPRGEPERVRQKEVAAWSMMWNQEGKESVLLWKSETGV